MELRDRFASVAGTDVAPSEAQFVAVLRDVAPQLSAPQLKSLWRQMDGHASGTVEVAEVCRVIEEGFGAPAAAPPSTRDDAAAPSQARTQASTKARRCWRVLRVCVVELGGLLAQVREELAHRAEMAQNGQAKRLVEEHVLKKAPEVRLTLNAEEEAPEYFLQGDLEMYSADNMAARQSLQRHPKIVKASRAARALGGGAQQGSGGAAAAQRRGSGGAAAAAAWQRGAGHGSGAAAAGRCRAALGRR